MHADHIHSHKTIRFLFKPNDGKMQALIMEKESKLVFKKSKIFGGLTEKR